MCVGPGRLRVLFPLRRSAGPRRCTAGATSYRILGQHDGVRTGWFFGRGARRALRRAASCIWLWPYWEAINLRMLWCQAPAGGASCPCTVAGCNVGIVPGLHVSFSAAHMLAEAMGQHRNNDAGQFLPLVVRPVSRLG